MSDTLTPRSLSRRRFVQSSGALLFAAQCPVGLSRKAYAGGAGAMMNSFVRIDPNNVITMLANNSEFGNGAYTVMSMMLAEELDVDYRSIALEAAPTTPEYYSPLFREYLTAGSVTTGSTFMPMRTAGAKARAMLLEAASQDWQVPTTELTTEGGKVTHAASGRSSTYGELLEAIHRLDIQPPETVALKDPSEFKINQINQDTNQGTEYQPPLVRYRGADGVGDNKKRCKHGGAAEQVKQCAAAALGAAAVVTHERTDSESREHRDRCMPGKHSPIK